MKITKAELKQIIKEELAKEAINPGGLTARQIQRQIDRENAAFDAAKKRGDEEAMSRAARERGVYQRDMTGALPDPEEDSVDDQTKKMLSVDEKDVDKIRKLATDLETGLRDLEKEGKIDSELELKQKVIELKQKATDIINDINTGFYG